MNDQPMSAAPVSSPPPAPPQTIGPMDRPSTPVVHTTPPSPVMTDLEHMEQRLGRHFAAIVVLFILWFVLFGLWLWTGSKVNQPATTSPTVENLDKRLDDTLQRAKDYADSKNQALTSRIDDLTQMMRSMQETVNNLKTANDGQNSTPNTNGINK